MESLWGSVKLMLFVYALTAVISMAVAWVIKLVFAAIRSQGNRAQAAAGAAAERKQEA